MTLVLGRIGLSGLSVFSCGIFLLQNGSLPCITQISASVINKYNSIKASTKEKCRLTAGGLLMAQKGSRPVQAQTCSGSFKIFFTAFVTSSSVSCMFTCRSGSSTLPVYSHIKPERWLRGSILQDIQQRARSTPVKPLAIKALSLDSWGAYFILSLPVSL